MKPIDLTPLYVRLNELRDLDLTKDKDTWEKRLLGELNRIQDSDVLETPFMVLSAISELVFHLPLTGDRKVLEKAAALAKNKPIGTTFGGLLRGIVVDLDTGKKEPIQLIYLREDLSPSHAFKVLAHEIGHYLTDRDPKAPMEHKLSEAAAELVAFVLCQDAGYDLTELSALYLHEHGIGIIELDAVQDEVRKAVTELRGLTNLWGARVLAVSVYEKFKALRADKGTSEDQAA